MSKKLMGIKGECFIGMILFGNFIHSNESCMEKRGYETKLTTQIWTYEFNSEGPKGTIKKVIQFTPYYINGETCFNLCFGDWNAETKSVDDLIITDNKDSLEVLVTVARSVMAFTKFYPTALIYLKGSSASRNRLYQIGIAKHWIEISAVFSVYGLTNNKWQLFLKNVNYDAFMVLRKKDVYLGY